MSDLSLVKERMLVKIPSVSFDSVRVLRYGVDGSLVMRRIDLEVILSSLCVSGMILGV